MMDFLIVGAGLFGSIFAHEAARRGRSCLLLEKRAQVGGNIRCESCEGIQVHVYGAHIFHTNNRMVWDYVNQFVPFRPYVHSPLANDGGTLYPLPFNMNTFRKMWHIATPEEAAAKIAQQRQEIQGEPRNLEEQAISLVGRDLYEKLIRGYTEKQWGRKCTELPAFIIRRLPVRFTYNNNYFDARYQGIPIGGYNKLIDALLDVEGIEVRRNTEVHFRDDPVGYRSLARTVVYTGALDEYFRYCYGPLAYRGLRFETERLIQEDYQGTAVVNFSSAEVPYTRIIEHKHFEGGHQPVTYITREYPQEWQPGEEAYYPVKDERNQKRYAQYARLAAQDPQLILGGRLARYEYYDMDQVVALALETAENLLG